MELHVRLGFQLSHKPLHTKKWMSWCQISVHISVKYGLLTEMVAVLTAY